MDITKISDTNQLKAWAYDQLILLEQTQNNLKLLNDRIAELEKIAPDKVKPTTNVK